MIRFPILLVLPLVFGLALPAAGQGDQASDIVKILSTRTLWGKDFPAALSSLPHWNRIGERTVALFPDRFLGATPFRTAEAAQPTRVALSQALSQTAPSPVPAFVELLGRLTGRPFPFQSDVVQSVDDDSYRVAITGSNLQYLAPRLTVRQVETEIGPPEAVTTQVIQSERDRRPVTLTLHSYANGAIIFAESDWMPPGLIDRVILDVPVVSAIVFRGGQ